ncbi:GNAT family N-acetyltransferase [Streptomyces sp. H27-D2]|uniref:GNAT family N-acetyltransferase n=1 Tax=Streptomyces sp. H27-D2 TaxID=3046304 RepID=UPI002DBAB667|nr:GNAT family N-acetyltransferase [Streptomyces sp. H27-D2]MEC4020399.1 GNAT family N-acetyltransferase [Streptomyces sp. H27-D2]
MTTPDRILTGFGLHLRGWTEQDLPAMVELFDEPEIARWTPMPSPFGPAEARERLAGGRADPARIPFAITEDGTAPRGEGLVIRTGHDGYDAELGYVIGARYRGQGLAVRALRLLTDYAHVTLGLDRLALRIEEENTASCAVARSAGYRLTDDEPVVRGSRDKPVILRTWQHGE